MATVATLLLCVAFAHFSGLIAERRGRSVRAWVWLGAVFGPLALVVVALMPPRGSVEPI